MIEYKRFDIAGPTPRGIQISSVQTLAEVKYRQPYVVTPNTSENNIDTNVISNESLRKVLADISEINVVTEMKVYGYVLNIYAIAFENRHTKEIAVILKKHFPDIHIFINGKIYDPNVS